MIYYFHHILDLLTGRTLGTVLARLARLEHDYDQLCWEHKRLVLAHHRHERTTKANVMALSSKVAERRIADRDTTILMAFGEAGDEVECEIVVDK